MTSLTSLTAILCALSGLVFGSFLNVCIERLPRHQSIVSPRSRCTHCGAQVRVYDNIPLLSWLLLKGQCRHCKAPISRRYSFVEAATAGLFVVCYLRFGMTIEGVGNAVFCFLLLGLAWMDAETMLLPDAFTLPGIALGVVFAAAGYGGVVAVHGFSLFLNSALRSMLAAAVAAALILLVRRLYWLFRRRQGMGLGDAKLLAMIAAWLRLEMTLLTFFLAVIFAALVAVALLAAESRKAERRHHKEWLSRRLPLGSFLSAAAIYSVFLGTQTLKWYLSFFRH